MDFGRKEKGMTAQIYEDEPFVMRSLETIKSELLYWLNKVCSSDNKYLEKKRLTWEVLMLRRHTNDPKKDEIHIKYPGPNGQEGIKLDWNK